MVYLWYLVHTITCSTSMGDVITLVARKISENSRKIFTVHKKQRILLTLWLVVLRTLRVHKTAVFASYVLNFFFNRIIATHDNTNFGTARRGGALECSFKGTSLFESPQFEQFWFSINPCNSVVVILTTYNKIQTMIV